MSSYLAMNHHDIKDFNVLRELPSNRKMKGSKKNTNKIIPKAQKENIYGDNIIEDDDDDERDIDDMVSGLQSLDALMNALASEEGEEDDIVEDLPLFSTKVSEKIEPVSEVSETAEAPVEKKPSLLYRTKLCSYFAVGKCKRGDKCTFAHDRDMLRPRPDLAQTQLCQDLLTMGHCSRGASCLFAHSASGLKLIELTPAELELYQKNLELAALQAKDKAKKLEAKLATEAAERAEKKSESSKNKKKKNKKDRNSSESGTPRNVKLGSSRGGSPRAAMSRGSQENSISMPYNVSISRSSDNVDSDNTPRNNMNHTRNINATRRRGPPAPLEHSSLWDEAKGSSDIPDPCKIQLGSNLTIMNTKLTTPPWTPPKFWKKEVIFTPNSLDYDLTTDKSEVLFRRRCKSWHSEEELSKIPKNEPVTVSRLIPEIRRPQPKKLANLLGYIPSVPSSSSGSDASPDNKSSLGDEQHGLYNLESIGQVKGFRVC